jgi:predicted DNA-binding protein
MGRHKLFQGDEKQETVSFRVSADLGNRIKNLTASSGFSRSDILRNLVQHATDNDFARAIKNAEIEQVSTLSGRSLRELKQKRIAALRTVAWIDAQIKAAADHIEQRASANDNADGSA